MHRVFISTLAILSSLTLCLSVVSCSSGGNSEGTNKSQNVKKSEETKKLEQEALVALKKLYSKIGIGISIKEYSESLQDPKFAVEQLRDNSNSTLLMKKVMQGNLMTLDWWRCDLEGYDDDKDAKCRDALLADILDKYPLIKSKSQALIDNSEQTYKSRALDKDAVLQLMWIEDKKDLIKAEIAIIKEKQEQL